MGTSRPQNKEEEEEEEGEKREPTMASQSVSVMQAMSNLDISSSSYERSCRQASASASASARSSAATADDVDAEDHKAFTSELYSRDSILSALGAQGNTKRSSRSRSSAEETKQSIRVLDRRRLLPGLAVVQNVQKQDLRRELLRLPQQLLCRR